MDTMIAYCGIVCSIRACAQEKHHDHCGECSDYACAALENFHLMVPIAKKSLEKLRNKA